MFASVDEFVPEDEVADVYAEVDVVFGVAVCVSVYADGGEGELDDKRQLSDVLAGAEPDIVLGRLEVVWFLLLVLWAAKNLAEGGKGEEIGAEVRHAAETEDRANAQGGVLVGAEGFVELYFAVRGGRECGGLEDRGGVVVVEFFGGKQTFAENAEREVGAEGMVMIPHSMGLEP